MRLCFFGLCKNNVICVDLEEMYFCRCDERFIGWYCDIDINECKFFFCKNGVICLNIYGFYNCKCRKEWIGIYCDKDVNECLNNLCF